MSTLSSPTDDRVATFQLDGKPLRGRIAQLGAGSLAPILARHDYPTEIARLLGEAATLAALVGSSLKFEGRLLVQAEGDGPISLLVGEYSTNGGLRAYAKYDAERWANLDRINKGARPHMPQVFGKGALALIMISNDQNMKPYQGVVPLVKGTLAECAEVYFMQSEQVPTKVALSVAEHSVSNGEAHWRSGGMLLQKIAGDDARGQTDDVWDEARALFGTLTDAELADPSLPAETLLYNLFHESGVRSEISTEVRDECTCSHERLKGTLSSMPDAQLHEMTEGDTVLGIDCQFCARHYDIQLADVTGGA